MTTQTEAQLEEESKNVFNKSFDKYLKEKDLILHKKAIRGLLEEVGLEEDLDIMDEEYNPVEEFFLNWKKAGKIIPNDSSEKASVMELGRKSKKFYDKRQYRKLHNLFFDTMFRHVMDFLDIEKHKEFDTLTDADLYEKDIIPSEIHFQYFLLEAPLRMKEFDWHRCDEIMMQHLACLIVCFEDIYEFLHEMNNQN